jgi:alkanesulfonate monooxygenase SsuD/methylene tetrahydromethanopterin reductase-like flavin-dependent oxidoreductase (luciferase family)
MKVWHFSEGAYPYLPPEEDYNSVRVTLPNGVYDPKIGAELYHRFLDEWLYADEEGLDIQINEHHQTPTCVDPAAPIILGILARQTKKARLLILGNPIGNRTQPVRVAEEMAMVDVLSRGRVEAGFVRSVPYEIAAGNSNPVRLRERMWEALDLIVKSWTTHDGPFSFEGQFFHHRMVNIWPRPYQQPHPPIWIASTSHQGVTQIGERGYVLGTFFVGHVEAKKIFDAYRAGWKKAGRPGPTPLDRLGYACLVYTGDTDEEGREGGKKLMWYMSHNKIPLHFKNPAGYLPPVANIPVLRTGQAGRPADYVPDLDDLVNRGLLFCGSPDTVVKQIKRFYDYVGGFGHILSMGQAGFLEHKETLKGIRLLAREVYPRLRELMPVEEMTA